MGSKADGRAVSRIVRSGVLPRSLELGGELDVDIDYDEGVGRDFYAYDVVSPGVVIAFPIHF